ncbi:hypothetical protein ACJ41O_004526 [Fusarium nematophilum]
MAAFKINALAKALALLGAFATGAVAEAALSGYTTTESPVTQQHGATTSDGVILYTMSVCTIVHQTECSMTMSTGGQVPSAPATDLPSVPAEGQPTSYHGQGETSPGEGLPEPSETGPHASAATGDEPGYTAPPADGTAPGEPGEPVPSGEPAPSGEPVPAPSVVSTTDASGNPTVLTTAYDEPSGTASGSESGVSPSPTGDNDGEETPVTSTPGVTATGAAAMPNAAPLAALGIAGMFAAAII